MCISCTEPRLGRRSPGGNRIRVSWPSQRRARLGDSALPPSPIPRRARSSRGRPRTSDRQPRSGRSRPSVGRLPRTPARFGTTASRPSPPANATRSPPRVDDGSIAAATRRLVRTNITPAADGGCRSLTDGAGPGRGVRRRGRSGRPPAPRASRSVADALRGARSIARRHPVDDRRDPPRATVRGRSPIERPPGTGVAAQSAGARPFSARETRGSSSRTPTTSSPQAPASAGQSHAARP